MKLFRIIAPASAMVGIFSKGKTTALGPVMVATAANKVPGIRIEVIFEDNWVGPVTKNGLPDHEKLQRDDPADVVGFYTGLSSTILRAWELAEFYHNQGVWIIAGGYHSHYFPEETLLHNMDIVVHGDGEEVIVELLNAYLSSAPIDKIIGISFVRDDGRFQHNYPDNESQMLEVSDLNSLPYPDFALVRNSGRIKSTPISGSRGCKMKCEFCMVNGEPRWATAEHLFKTVVWLVETRRAKRFFIVDDNFLGRPKLVEKFCKRITERYGNRLRFTIQARIELAKNPALMKIMRGAGICAICVGFESPIDEDLIAMNKGYLSKDMLNLIKILRRYFRWIHGMGIVGYPHPPEMSVAQLSAKETVKRFNRFIRRAKFHSIQIMLAGPGIGTPLRARLEREDRLYPRDVVGYSSLDGSRLAFFPKGMTVQELQKLPLQIMGKFYNLWNIIRIPFRIATFPEHVFFKGWRHWLWKWLRDLTLVGGYFLVKRRRKIGDARHVAKLLAYDVEHRSK